MNPKKAWVQPGQVLTGKELFENMVTAYEQGTKIIIKAMNLEDYNRIYFTRPHESHVDRVDEAGLSRVFKIHLLKTYYILAEIRDNGLSLLEWYGRPKDPKTYDKMKPEKRERVQDINHLKFYQGEFRIESYSYVDIDE